MNPMATGPFQVGDQALFDLNPLFALGSGPNQGEKTLTKVMECRTVGSKKTAQQRSTFLQVAKSVRTGRTAWRQFDQNQLQSGALAKLPGEKMVQIGHVQQTGLDIDPGLFNQTELPFNDQPGLLQPVDSRILAKKWIKPDDQSHNRLAIQPGKGHQQGVTVNGHRKPTGKHLLMQERKGSQALILAAEFLDVRL